MNIEISKQEKNEVEFKIDNQTIAEILRVYLNNEEVDFAAWKKEHPTKPLIMKIQTSNKTAKKALNDAVESIRKDLDKISSSVKKK
mgnify:FL=1